MKTIKEIRRINARNLRNHAGGNSSFAKRIDREPTQTSRFLGENATKNIGDDLARHIEECFKKPVGWLDQDHPEQNINSLDLERVSGTSLTIHNVPVISWVQAAAWTSTNHEEVDLSAFEAYPCPVPCGPTTYILRVTGESMIDEYKPGEMIFVDPDVAPVHGDDVVALMTNSGETTFRRLIEDGSERYLKALNKSWPEPYIRVTDNCTIIGTVIFSGKPRRYQNRS